MSRKLQEAGRKTRKGDVIKTETRIAIVIRTVKGRGAGTEIGRKAEIEIEIGRKAKIENVTVEIVIGTVAETVVRKEMMWMMMIIIIIEVETVTGIDSYLLSSF